MSDMEAGRGRQGVVSTGRGGAGNAVRSPSRGIDPEPTPGIERGREMPARDLSVERAMHSGRGGAGNIRSPSRDPTARIAEEENESAIQERLIAEQRGRQADAPFSTGRGGVGNISRDKSRSRSAVRGATPELNGTPGKEHHAHGHASGRGGWGNVQEERESVDLEKDAAAKRYEASVAAKHRADDAGKIHSSGKGGAGNMTSKTLTPEEFNKLNLEEQEAIKKLQAQSNQQYMTGGRGGAGNYHHRDREQDTERGREAHKGPGGGLFGNVMRSLSRAKNGDRARD